VQRELVELLVGQAVAAAETSLAGVEVLQQLAQARTLIRVIRQLLL
jgi:hypothetical protein